MLRLMIRSTLSEAYRFFRWILRTVLRLTGYAEENVQEGTDLGSRKSMLGVRAVPNQ